MTCRQSGKNTFLSYWESPLDKSSRKILFLHYCFLSKVIWFWWHRVPAERRLDHYSLEFTYNSETLPKISIRKGKIFQKALQVAVIVVNILEKKDWPTSLLLGMVIHLIWSYLNWISCLSTKSWNFGMVVRSLSELFKGLHNEVNSLEVWEGKIF
jgi:hypothetical protein